MVKCAHNMSAVASAAGFATHLLLTAEAVLEALGGAATDLVAGDTFLLTHSGHGGQIPDTGGDEEDGQDETWVPYDRRLLDEGLRGAYCSFAEGVRVAVLSDSCHSGTVTRMGPRWPRGQLPPRRSGRPSGSQRDFLRRSETYDAQRQDTLDSAYRRQPERFARRPGSPSLPLKAAINDPGRRTEPSIH